jgi:hypothetical protein
MQIALEALQDLVKEIRLRHAPLLHRSTFCGRGARTKEQAIAAECTHAAEPTSGRVRAYATNRDGIAAVRRTPRSIAR